MELPVIIFKYGIKIFICVLYDVNGVTWAFPLKLVFILIKFKIVITLLYISGLEEYCVYVFKLFNKVFKCSCNVDAEVFNPLVYPDTT